MVSYFLFFWLAVFYPLSNVVALSDISVNATLDSTTLYEGWPIKGTLEITHYSSEKVDETSTSMNGQPLKVSLLRNVQISPDSQLMVSIYTFTLPVQKKGTLTLPVINVTVGGKSYQTLSNTYEVQAPIAAPAIQASGPNENVFLKLEAFIEGPKKLYPGQMTRLVYRYIYAGNIDLSHEVLPMLDAVGVQKIGRYDIKNFTEGDKSIFEISQQVQALKPGTFSWGPSTIEGVVYITDSQGNKQYTSTKLKSEVATVELVIQPFPEKDKPASFNGAFGQFNWDIKLVSSSKISVGDPISLNVVITGKTSNWDSVQLPEICCQPGFSGFFRMSDLPPVGKVEGDSKHYLVEMNPLSPAIKSIPTLQFSFFEPEKGTYKTLFSNPIGIEVAAIKDIAEGAPADLRKGLIEPQETAQEWRQIYNQLPPLETSQVARLDSNDLENKKFGGWSSLWLIPLAIGLIIFQIKLKDILRLQAMQVKTTTSNELYEKMLAAPPASAAFFHYLYESLLLKLNEHGDIPSANISLDDLPQEGKTGLVRAFLMQIEVARYKNAKPDLEIYKQALEDGKNLFNEI